MAPLGLDVVKVAERVPASERIVDHNIFDAIERWANTAPDAPALSLVRSGTASEGPEVVTYRELAEGIAAAANLFLALAGRRGAAVAIILPNSPQAHFAFWGAEAVGTAFPLNPFLEVLMLTSLIERAGAIILVCCGPSLDQAVWEKAQAIAAGLPSLKHIVPVETAAAGSRESFLARVRDASPRLERTHRSRLQDQAALFATGGTTGAPKIVCQSHWNQLVNVWMVGDTYRFAPGESVFCGMPMFHVAGAFLGGIGVFGNGGHVVQLTERGYRHPEVLKNFWRLVERYKPRTFAATPTIIADLIRAPLDGADISSLKFATVSAAPLPIEVMRAFEQRTGVPILEGYGQTEATMSIAGLPFGSERRPGSVGVRKPYMDVRAAVLDGSRLERFCAPNETGMIVAKGPNVTAGYLDPKHTADLFTADGWLITGDLGCIDKDGYIWLRGRSKDVIKRGGHGIDPRLIEEALSAFPAVKLCAAVGMPHERLGEVPVAYVVLAEGASATEEELIEFAAKHIPERAAVPKRIFVIDKMPMTAINKVFKPALRELAAVAALSGALASLMTRLPGVSIAPSTIDGQAGAEIRLPSARRCAALPFPCGPSTLRLSPESV